MNEQELKQDYELLGLTLCQNLREHGDLTPPNVSMEALNEPFVFFAEKDGFRVLTNDKNMLRACAYLKENDTFQPCFLNPTDFTPRLKLKEDARPLFLQQEAEDGSYDLVPYYPVAAFEAIPDSVYEKMPRLYQQAAKDFWENRIAEKGADAAFRECFNPDDSVKLTLPSDIAVNFAIQQRCHPQDAKLFAAFALKQFHFPPPSREYPLFSDSAVKAFEAKPAKMVEELHPLQMMHLASNQMIIRYAELHKEQEAAKEAAEEAAPPARLVIHDYLCKKSDLPHFREMLANDSFVDMTATPPLDTYAVYPPVFEGKFQDTIASTVGGWEAVDLPKASTTERSAIPDSMAWFSSTRPPELMTDEPVLVAMPGDELRALKEIGDHSYDTFADMDKPDYYREAGAYYLSYANLLAPDDPQDSDRTFLACAVSKMKKDGIGKDDMEYILKASPKPELAETLPTVLNAGKDAPAR